MKSDRSQLSETWLRALAITAVVGLHVLASLPSYSYTTAWFHPITIAIDQLWRFCIPLFVALSGYGLQLKYQRSEFSWRQFLSRRVFKLVPGYFTWSLITYLLFVYIPVWRPTGTPVSFGMQLLKGQADYHLYFVPMIFQLYILFPFLFPIVKRFAWQTLSLAAVFQIVLYWYFMSRGAVFANGQILVTDQQQYFWSFTWVFYFVLGMCLPKIHQWLQVSWLRKVSLLLLTGVSLAVAIGIAVKNIDQGMDPIVALRFTRIPVLMYGTLSVITLTWLITKVKSLPPLIGQIGKQSYWIYLTHTIWLRVIFQLL
jgi:peptidoglycan/LPS O-acetylase OafA/YrhL